MNELADTSSEDNDSSSISLVVPRRLVKVVKSSLESTGHFDRRLGIRPISTDSKTLGKELYVVPTSYFVKTFSSPGGALECLAQWPEILESTALEQYSGDIWVTSVLQGRDVAPLDSRSQASQKSRLIGLADHGSSNVLARSVGKWVASLPDEVLNCLWPVGRSNTSVSSCRNVSYTIYPPLLLVCPSFLSDLPLHNLPQKCGEYRDALYEDICKALRVSHVALTGAITTNIESPQGYDTLERRDSAQMNVLRSPTAFKPLYGDFGPDLGRSHHPTIAEFESAFWCSCRQNGLTQIWAPRYTMFSRGNLSEKARILQLDTLKAETLGCPPSKTSAVDLYSGIGYFAFSYAKVGVGNVLCWEINPWSVEGLRKGARASNLRSLSINAGEVPAEDVKQSKLLLYEQSNEHASRGVNQLRDLIPPVRHVNCGYLPSSEASWGTAVECLDPLQGGWIHAHENVEILDIEKRGNEVVDIFRQLTCETHSLEAVSLWRVSCDHIEKVKSYAPRIMHCVFDIAIAPVNATI